MSRQELGVSYTGKMYMDKPSAPQCPFASEACLSSQPVRRSFCYSLQDDCWQARVGPKKLRGRMHTEDRGRQRTVTFAHSCWR